MKFSLIALFISTSLAGSEADYEKINQIGQGSFGTVYRSLYAPTKTTVVIKKQKPDAPRDVAETFANEELILRDINSRPGTENVIILRDTFASSNGTTSLVFENAPGGDLLTATSSRWFIHTIPKGIRKRVFREMAMAVKQVHQSGYCHNDIKVCTILAN